MPPEKYQYYKFKFKAPDLTIDQADLIGEFDNSLLNFSTKYSLSTWEEMDYELATMSDILTSDQFTVFQKIQTEFVKRHEQELVSKDMTKINEVSYCEEHLKYIEENILPDLFNDPFLLSLQWLHSDMSKVTLLKSEYKLFLTDQKINILSHHFRHNRTFQPNQLKISLLRHKTIHLIPDYSLFLESMDEPTKVINNYLASKVKGFPESTEILIETKFKNLRNFVKANYGKYFEENIGGWHITIPEPTEQEKREQLIMTLLLLDRERYGC